MTPAKLDFANNLSTLENTRFEGFMFTLIYDINGTPTDKIPDIATVDLHIRTGFGKSPALIKLELGSGISVISGTPNKLFVEPFLVEFPSGNYVYDIKIVFNDGSDLVPYQGIFQVKPISTINIL